jgi:hypothetical protein
MRPPPRLLETYEEARLLFEAKGWGLAKAAEHLSELPEMGRFHISHPKLSKRTTPGSKFPIEPEVAAAVEGMQTWRGYERQTEIVTAGLRAAHGDPPIVDVDRLAAELKKSLPSNELALKLVETLEEKASQRADSFFQKLAERLGRISGKQIAISAGSGALVGCLALLVMPLLPGHALAATQPGPPVVIIHHPTLGDSPLWFEPGSLLAIGDPGGGAKRPAEQEVPKFTLPGQKVAPCDEGLGQEAIHGNCWVYIFSVKPPCGRLFRHDNKCYAPVAAEPKKPAP